MHKRVFYIFLACLSDLVVVPDLVEHWTEVVIREGDGWTVIWRSQATTNQIASSFIFLALEGFCQRLNEGFDLPVLQVEAVQGQQHESPWHYPMARGRHVPPRWGRDFTLRAYGSHN